MFSEQQKEIILQTGIDLIGEKFSGINCLDFINKIYNIVDVSLELKNCPMFSFFEIFKKEAVGYPIFLRRKKTKSSKRVTHIGIILHDNFVLHYSRWMNGEPGFYQVFHSSFEELFKIYDFVEPN